MKKRLITLFSACLALLCANVSGQGIEFFKGTFDEAMEKAAEENKIIFIDFYADWCGPCKTMDANVFPDSALGDLFRDRVVALKIDTEDDNSQLIVNKYKVQAMPTLIFINTKLEVLTQVTGALSVDGLLRQAKIALGEAPDFTKLYDQYRSSKDDPGIARQLLQDAPAFFAGLSDKMEIDKWNVRVDRIFKDYFKKKKGPELINAEDYTIMRSFNPKPGANDEIAEFIVANIGQYIETIGTPPAYYVIEYNAGVMQRYAHAGNMEYKKWLDRIEGDMAPAYAVLPKTSLTPKERETYRYDAEYVLFSKKDADGYIEMMNKYMEALGADASDATYAEASQKLYKALGNKMPENALQQARIWMSHALDIADPASLINKLNYTVMLADTYRDLKDYASAKKYYNQAFLESYQLGRPATESMMQAVLKRKLAQLELLE